MLQKIISILIAVLIVFKISNTAGSDIESVCTTPGCLDAAELIQSNIDESVDPCEDFYNFACGGFVRNANITDGEQTVNRLSGLDEQIFREIRSVLRERFHQDEPRIFKLVKRYFKACTDLRSDILETIESLGLQPLENIIQLLGGWPVIVGDTWDEDNFNILDTIINLTQLGFNGYLFNVFVSNDAYNTSRLQLYIEDGELGISSTALKRGFNSTTVQIYFSYMIEVAKLLGADPNRAYNELLEVLEFEIVLALIATEQSLNSKNGRLWIKNIDDLETQVPYVPWLKYLNLITEPMITLTGGHRIIVQKPYYLRNLEFALENTSKRVHANYLIWRMIMDSAPHLSKNIRQLKKRLNKKFNRVNEAKVPRWKTCINWLADKKSGLIVGLSALYVRRYFNDRTKREIRNIVQLVAHQFNRLLSKITWMDYQTKYWALKKSLSMRQIIGYPDELLDDEIIDDYSYNLDLEENSHFENTLRLRRFHYEYSLSRYNSLSSTSLWTTLSDSTTVNAYYHPISNTFVLLAGILQRPMFHPDWPNYAKYGSAGFVIAHEMMHAFDLDRFAYDETGSFKRWYTDESADEYLKRIACYVDQYETFVDEDTGLNVNGSLTLNENLADNAGVKVAHSAYNMWKRHNGKESKLPGLNYTTEQLYWITSVNFLCSKDTDEYNLMLMLTSEHTPNYYRVLAQLSNSKQFANAFHCPVGSPMNPYDKCTLF